MSFNSCETPLDSDTKEVIPVIDNGEYKMGDPETDNLRLPDTKDITTQIISSNPVNPPRALDTDIIIDDIRYRILTPERIILYTDIFIKHTATTFKPQDKEGVHAIKLRFEGELIKNNKISLNRDPLSRYYATLFLDIKNGPRPIQDNFDRVLLDNTGKNAFLEVLEIEPNGSFVALLTIERLKPNGMPFKIEVKVEVN
jgi:hypothetical protein